MTNNSRLQLFNDAKKIKGKKINLISNKNVKKNLNMVNLNMGTFRTNFKLQLHINMRPTNFTLTNATNKNFRTLTRRPLIKSTLILTWHDHATLMKTSKFTISIFQKS